MTCKFVHWPRDGETLSKSLKDASNLHNSDSLNVRDERQRDRERDVVQIPPNITRKFLFCLLFFFWNEESEICGGFFFSLVFFFFFCNLERVVGNIQHLQIGQFVEYLFRQRLEGVTLQVELCDLEEREKRKK